MDICCFINILPTVSDRLKKFNYDPTRMNSVQSDIEIHFSPIFDPKYLLPRPEYITCKNISISVNMCSGITVEVH